MTRSLFTTAAGAILLAVAGCGPGDRDYQKVAVETPWRFPKGDHLPSCLDRHSSDYQIAEWKEGGETTISITQGDKELFSYLSHSEPSYIEDGGTFYYALYNYGTSGCTLLAYDLRAGKQLWERRLKGLRPITHEKYRNQVWIEPLDEATVIVFGNEAYGQYVEIVDRKTGKTVGHKVVK